MNLQAVAGATLLAFSLGLVALFLFRQRRRLGAAAFPIFIGAIHFTSLILSSWEARATAATLSVASVLYGCALLAVLLLYLREDIPRTRSLIYGIFLADLALATLVWSLPLFAPIADTMPLASTSILRPRVFAAGLSTVLLDSLLVVVIFEVLLFKLPRVPLVARIFGTLLSILLLDAAIFSFGAFFGTPQFQNLLSGQLTGKALAGVIYGLLLYLYLLFGEPRPAYTTESRTTQMLDVFSIVTYRERYREVKRQLELAEAASTAKSRFLAHMSHELRTPLNAIIGFTNVLLKSDREEQERLYLGRILQNGMDLLKIINGLLDLSKIESGQTPLNVSITPLKELLTETVDQLRGTALEKDLVLRCEIPERSVFLMTDRALLKQVLVNLLGNAIKFTDRGEIAIRLHIDPVTSNPNRIEVEDNGIGIPPEKQELIFEAFEQAEPGTDRTHGGTGLGLAISRAFCDRLGFHLKVRSDTASGSTFSVILHPNEGPTDPTQKE